MNEKISPLKLIIYFILGIIVLSVGFKVVMWLIKLALNLVAIILTVALIIIVGYFAYCLLTAVCRRR